VVGFAEDGSGRVADVVTRTYRVIQDEYFVLNGSTRVTGTHPFLSTRGWVTVRELQPGDVLIAAGGRKETVESVEKRTSLVRAYNIEVNGSHTFIADGYVVHNKPPDPTG
jgi:intein/homing endonuclease